MKPNVEELRARLDRHRGFLQQDPHNMHLVTEVSDIHFELGEFNHAREMLEHALSLWPSQASILSRLASVAMASGDSALAVRLFNNLLESGQDDPVIHYNLAYAYLYEGQADNAKQQLLQIDASVEQFPQFPILMAQVQHHLGEMDDAINKIQDYLKQHSDDPTALGILALLSLDIENNEVAQTAAKKSLSFDPNNLNSLVTLGSLSLNTQDADKANSYFEKAVTLHPKSGRSWSGMGLTDMLRLDIDKAIKDLQLAVKYMPGHIGTWHALAWCQLVKNDFENAEESFNRSMEIDRNFSETHGGLAVVHVLQNKRETAELEMKRSIKLNPLCFAGRFAQSLLLNNSNPEEAQAIIKNVLASSPLKGESLQTTLQRMMTQKKQ